MLTLSHTRWDLSPQGNKELLVVVITVAFLKCNTPLDYATPMAGDDQVDVFNFFLPIQQCANKKGRTVAAKIQEALQMVGLKRVLFADNTDDKDDVEAAAQGEGAAAHQEGAQQGGGTVAQESHAEAEEADSDDSEEEDADERTETAASEEETEQERVEAAQEAGSMASRRGGSTGGR